MRPRVLIAGVGNLFFGDDGFGVEVARRLSALPWPEEVSVVDYGIRGVHLAYDLLDPPELLVIADAVGRDRPPGTLYVIDPAVDPDLWPADPDPHGMSLSAVFSSVRQLGGALPTTRIVGCEPLTVAEGIGLSDPVAQALDGALRLIRELVEATLGSPRPQVGGPERGEADDGQVARVELGDGGRGVGGGEELPGAPALRADQEDVDRVLLARSGRADF